MSQINAMESSKLGIARAGVTQENRAAVLKQGKATDSPTVAEVDSHDIRTHSSVRRFDGENRQFFVEEDLDQMVVQIMNTDTKELVRQIPTEEALLLAKKLQDMMGMMAATTVDEGMM
jgi:flagellar protein FlaG